MLTVGAIIDAMKRACIKIAAGLTPSEFAEAEEHFGFRFPPDLRSFLAEALPVGERFPNWRHPQSEQLATMMEWPLDGLLFDIERNDFWLVEWGERPQSLDDAFAVAGKAVAEAPTLIQVYGHRYMPDEPQDGSNPVFSVYQTDIIYYGANLLDYLENEFDLGLLTNEQPAVREIRFWSRLVELNR
jgi:hypothetical protein